MKKIHLAIATLFLMTAGSIVASAQTNPCPNPNCPGPQQGKGNGKRLGPKDGSGPQHEPGTGGGTGAGQRRGRK
jgi:uncharacterized membrane protein (UPF0127 family)